MTVSRSYVTLPRPNHSRKPQNILHVIQTAVLVGQPDRSPDRAVGESHAAGGFMGDFHALAVVGKHHGVLADDVPGTYRREADGLAVALAGIAFPAVNRAVFQVTAQRIGYHFAHAQCGAGRGVDFVPVMGFDHFNIGVIAHDFGGHFQQFKRQVDADAHVRRHHDCDVFGRIANPGFLRVAVTGGADDQLFPRRAADLDKIHGRIGAGEVDQHVELVDDGRQVIDDFNANLADARQFAGVPAYGKTPGAGCGNGQFGIFSQRRGFNQAKAHAAGGSYYSNTHH
jgi:hypothetical protein